MFWPLGVHGVGVLFVRPGADACRVPDGKRRRGLGRGAAAAAAGVHGFTARHLHGLLHSEWADGQRGPPGPAVPSDKFHRTGKEDRVSYFMGGGSKVKAFSNPCSLNQSFTPFPRLL